MTKRVKRGKGLVFGVEEARMSRKRTLANRAAECQACFGDFHPSNFSGKKKQKWLLRFKCVIHVNIIWGCICGAGA